MIQKIAEIDVVILEKLYEKNFPTQKELSFELNINPSTLHKAVCRLEFQNLIYKNKRFGDYEIGLNRHKKKEILSLLAMWKKVKQGVLDKNKTIVRIHGYIIYSKAKVGKYPRDKYKKHFPKNRICTLRKIGGLAKINIDINKSKEITPIQIFLEPFYLILEINLSDKEFLEKINRQVTNRYSYIKDILEEENIFIKDDYEVESKGCAIMDDWIAQKALKYSIKLKDEIDSSVGVPEYEIHSKEEIENIWNIIELRRFCIKNRIKEFELGRHKDEIIQILNNSSSKKESHSSERLKSDKGQFKSKIDTQNIKPFELLKILREIKGESYAELTKILGGYTRSHICEVISGKKVPNEDLKEKISNYFGLPEDFIWEK